MDIQRWQRWDGDNVAELLESYWLGSDSEAAHRRQLAAACAPHLASPRDSVLEVGCGTGLVYERLAELIDNDSYTGVDMSHRMLAIARRKFPAANFVAGDGYHLDFPARSFDVVVCFEVFGHLPRIDTMLAELLRVARRTVIFTVWPSAERVVEEWHQEFGDRFLYRFYPHEVVLDTLRAAAPTTGLDIEVGVLSAECWAYIAHPRQARGVEVRRLYPVPAPFEPAAR
jgi:ubiquinone/menaquinone biosynthesis C-methylase UbiE